MPKSPSIPNPPDQYDRKYFEHLTNVLRLYFAQLDNPDILKTGKLNFTSKDGTLVIPTQVDFPNLRYGDVYCDTSDGNRLKVRGLEFAGTATLSGTGSITATAT